MSWDKCAYYAALDQTAQGILQSPQLSRSIGTLIPTDTTYAVLLLPPEMIPHALTQGMEDALRRKVDRYYHQYIHEYKMKHAQQ